MLRIIDIGKAKRHSAALASVPSEELRKPGGKGALPLARKTAARGSYLILNPCLLPGDSLKKGGAEKRGGGGKRSICIMGRRQTPGLESRESSVAFLTFIAPISWKKR